MTNNVRHHAIENSPINSSTINFGDNSALSTRIQQLPEYQSELKDLLIELQTLINGSGLKPDDKQDALAETQIIVVAAQQSGEANSGSVRKALRYIKGLATECEDATQTAVKVGAVVTEIGNFFGL